MSLRRFDVIICETVEPLCFKRWKDQIVAYTENM